MRNEQNINFLSVSKNGGVLNSRSTVGSCFNRFAPFSKPTSVQELAMFLSNLTALFLGPGEYSLHRRTDRWTRLTSFRV